MDEVKKNIGRLLFLSFGTGMSLMGLIISLVSEFHNLYISIVIFTAFTFLLFWERREQVQCIKAEARALDFDDVCIIIEDVCIIIEDEAAFKEFLANVRMEGEVHVLNSRQL